MESDRDLLKAYESGDQDAFASLYSRHRRQVFAYLLSLVRERGPAEDLLQETFLRLLRRLPRLLVADDVRPLLITIARNAALDHLRRAKTRRREAGGAAVLVCAAAPGSWSAERRVEAEEVSELLYRLPEPLREVVVLKVLVGLTFAEIAELQALPEKTVVSRYRAAVARLRERLGGALTTRGSDARA